MPRPSIGLAAVARVVPERGRTVLRHSWRTQLKAAASEADVISVVQRYLAEWKPEEIESLPAGAWPADTTSPSAVVGHSVTLGRLHAEFQGAPGSLQPLQELLLFFTHAAVRMARVAVLDPPDEGPRRPVRRTTVAPRRRPRARAARAEAARRNR